MNKLKRKPQPIVPPKLKSRRVAREVTGAYHLIQNELEQIDKRGRSAEGSLPEDAERRKELESQMEQNGGVDYYQEASIISTTHFKTSRWVVRSLQEQPLNRKPTVKGGKLYTLEVGAINTQLQQCPWLRVRAIDLNSQDRLIEKQDMLTLPETTFGKFDVVLSSMVINCVPCPYRRFEMLARLALHIKADGVLFIILPTRCVESPLLGAEHFSNLLLAMGLRDAVARRNTPKLTFFTLVRRSDFGEIPLVSAAEGAQLSTFIARVAATLAPKTRQYLSSNKRIWDAPPSMFCMSTTPPAHA